MPQHFEVYNFLIMTFYGCGLTYVLCRLSWEVRRERGCWNDFGAYVWCSCILMIVTSLVQRFFTQPPARSEFTLHRHYTDGNSTWYRGVEAWFFKVVVPRTMRPDQAVVRGTTTSKKPCLDGIKYCYVPRYNIYLNLIVSVMILFYFILISDFFIFFKINWEVCL